MLPNPILKSRRNIAVYIALWTVVSAVQSVFAVKMLSHFAFNIHPAYFIADIMLSNVSFATMLAYAWIPINTIRWKNSSIANYIFLHLSMLLGFVTVSTLICKFIMWIISGDIQIPLLVHTFVPRLTTSLTIYVITVLTYHLYISIKQVQAKQINEIRLNHIIKENELNLLKSQINPHFLFNALNSLNSLIIQDPERAQKMQIALSDYLRYTVLSNNNPYSTLQHEINNVEQYISIEKIRFGSRLSYRFDVAAESLQVQMPSMILQPLFENSVKYGIYETLQQLTITLNTTVTDGRLTIVIANAYESQSAPDKRHSSGTGLNNIRERLYLMYGDCAGLYSQIKDNNFIITIHLPLRYASEKQPESNKMKK